MKHRRPTTLEPISAAMFIIVSLHLAVAFGVWWWWQDYRPGTAKPHLAWLKPENFKNTLPADSARPVPQVAATSAQAPPAAVRKAVSEPPVQKATLIAVPPQQRQMEPVRNDSSAPLFASATPAMKPAANRSITLRRAPEKRVVDSPFNTPAPPMSNPTLLDIARLNTLRTAPPSSSSAHSADVGEEVNMDGVDEVVNTAFLAGWTSPPIDEVPATQREARLNIAIGRDGTVLRAQMSKFSGSHVLDQSILEAAAKVKKISTALPSNFLKDSYDLELNFLLLP